jgi:DHA1 family tetracycline resistance protein-like MFS transporter
VNSLRGIAGLLGPGLFTYIFSKSIGAGAPVHLPGMPFFVAAGMLVAGLGLMVVIRQQEQAN